MSASIVDTVKCVVAEKQEAEKALAVAKDDFKNLTKLLQKAKAKQAICESTAEQEIKKAYEAESRAKEALQITMNKNRELQDQVEFDRDRIVDLELYYDDVHHSYQKSIESIIEKDRHNEALEDTIKAKDEHIARLEIAQEKANVDINELLTQAGQLQASYNKLALEESTQQQTINGLNEQLVISRFVIDGMHAQIADLKSRLSTSERSTAFWKAEFHKREELVTQNNTLHGELAALKAKKVRSERENQILSLAVETYAIESRSYILGFYAACRDGDLRRVTKLITKVGSNDYRIGLLGAYESGDEEVIDFMYRKVFKA